MKVGTLGYDTSRGLGHLVHDFHTHGIITDVCVVEHPSIPSNRHWYPGAPRTKARQLDHSLIRDFVRQCDVMLFFETPFDWTLLNFCKQHNVRTFLVTMYECTQERRIAAPDVYICPSDLDMQYFPGGVRLDLPVEVPWKRRGTIETFVHNGGYLGLRGREGTEELAQAITMVQSPAKYIVRCQESPSVTAQRIFARHPRVEFICETVPYETLHASGEALIAPQKFNGCSLPLQEAFASGLACITTRRFPMTQWLPNECMIHVCRTQRARIGGSYYEFDESIVAPRDIAAAIDTWYGKDAGPFSDAGLEYAKAHSWEALAPKWLEVLHA